MEEIVLLLFKLKNNGKKKTKQKNFGIFPEEIGFEAWKPKLT